MICNNKGLCNIMPFVFIHNFTCPKTVPTRAAETTHDVYLITIYNYLMTWLNLKRPACMLESNKPGISNRISSKKSTQKHVNYVPVPVDSKIALAAT